MLILRSVLVLYLYLCLSSCSDSDDDEDLGVPSTYTISCAARKDISPCTCFQHGTKEIWLRVICQKMTSFAQVVEALRNKIERTNQINLVIEFSNLEDLSEKKFSELESHISGILLRKNQMGGNLFNKSFEGIDTVTTLLLIDSMINEFPGTIFAHMPNVVVLTIQKTTIKSLSQADFRSLKNLSTLVIRNCNVTYIERDTFPQTIRQINLSHNNISTLNYTLRNLSNLEWVELAKNNLNTMEGEFPDDKVNSKLLFLDISNNNLTSLPKSFVNFLRLRDLVASSNKISNLDNILSNKMKLEELDLAKNRISKLASNEFEACKFMRYLNLSFNEISNLNKSMLPLKSLEVLKLTHNKLQEFSILEIIGLQLQSVELTHNKMKKFIGFVEKEAVLPDTVIHELELQYNELETLEGSLGGVKGLTYLNISHNKLTIMPTEFLDGLEDLKVLDVSYNFLVTLQDLSKASLGSLGTLYVTNNKITELSNDRFSGVCFMYLQNNKIRSVKADFVQRNQCVYQPGVNATLHVYLEGNSVLCRDDMQEIFNTIKSRNNTEIEGQCSKLPSEELKYNVGQNNSDSSSITVVTLEHNK